MLEHGRDNMKDTISTNIVKQNLKTTIPSSPKKRSNNDTNTNTKIPSPTRQKLQHDRSRVELLPTNPSTSIKNVTTNTKKINYVASFKSLCKDLELIERLVPGDGNCGIMSLIENLNCENKLNFKFDDETVGLFRRYFGFKIMELFLDDTIVFGDSLDDKLTYFDVIGPVIKDRLYEHEFCELYHNPKNGLLEDKRWIDLECFYNMMSFILKNLS